MATLTELVRSRVGDPDGELYSDDEIHAMIDTAVMAYSRARPIKRRWIKPVGMVEAKLPADYQEWVSGLEGCEIIGNTVYCLPWQMSVVYLANRTAEEVPLSDLQIIADYCFCTALEKAVSDSGDISSLKLGKGLQLSFANITEVRQLATDTRNQVMSSLNSIKGAWI